MPESQLIDFAFVNPYMLAHHQGAQASTRLVISGLAQGQMSDLAPLSSRQQSQVINHNLVDLAVGKDNRSQLAARATVATSALLLYCVRCGRALEPNGCWTCRIWFTLNQQDRRLFTAATPPIVPAKVVAFAVQECRLKFKLAPPQA